MRKIFGLALLCSSLHAMETYQNPQSLCKLAANKIAEMIISQDPRERAQCSLAHDPIPSVEDASLHVGQAIVQQMPGIILTYTKQYNKTPAIPLQAPATEEFDYISFCKDGSKLAARAQGHGFIGLAVYDAKQSTSPISFFDGFRQSPICWATDNKTLAVIDVSKQPCLYDYQTKHFFNLCPTKSIGHPCFHHEGKVALVATKDTIYTWNLEHNSIEQFFLQEHQAPIIPIAYADNGNIILARGTHALHLISSTNGNLLQSIPAERKNLASVIITHDGRFILTSFLDGTIKYLDSTTAACLHSWRLHDKIYKARLSHDGNTVACVGTSCIAHLIDLRISQCIKHLHNTIDGKSSQIYSCDFHPDGQQLATAGTKVINLWDLRTFNILREYLLTKLSAEQAICLTTIQGLLTK